MHTDYKVYCYYSPSDKYYVGQTRKSLNERANQGKGYRSSKKFYRAILKYGWDWFSKHRIILKSDLTKKEADYWERYYIQEFNSIDNGYNIQTGGEFNPAEVLSIPVVGINCKTKEVRFYDSSVIAARELGMNNKNISSCLNNVNNGKTSGGYVWIFKKDWDNSSEEEKEYWFSIKPYQHTHLRRKVYCSTTDIVYDSIKDAANSTGCFSSGIVKCCKGQQKYTTKNGVFYYWRYAEEEN